MVSFNTTVGQMTNVSVKKFFGWGLQIFWVTS